MLRLHNADMYQDVVSEASAEEEEEEEEDLPRNYLESSLADNLSVVTIKSEEEGVLTPSTPSLAVSSRQQQSPDDGEGPGEEEGDAFDDDASFPYRADIKFALGSGARRARRYCVDSEESVESVSSLGGGNMELDEEGIYVRYIGFF